MNEDGIIRYFMKVLVNILEMFPFLYYLHIISIDIMISKCDEEKF